MYIAKQLRERRMQRALLQFFKPENYLEGRKALEEAGRTDLIGGGCDALIPTSPPQEALRSPREKANAEARGEYVHKIATPRKGYRPGRKSAKWQERKDRR